MAGTPKFTFVNYTGEPDDESRTSLPAVGQHVMHDFLRRHKDANNDRQQVARTVGTEMPLSPCSNSTDSPSLPYHADSGFYNEHSTTSVVDFPCPYYLDNQLETAFTPQVKQVDSAAPVDLIAWHDHQDSGPAEASSISLAIPRYACGAQLKKSSFVCSMAPDSRDSGIDIDEGDFDEEAGEKHERSLSPSNSGRSWPLSNTGSMTSSGRSMDELDDLHNHFLDVEISRLRSSLLMLSKSERFLQYLRYQVDYQRYDSSRPQDQSADSSSKSASTSSSSSPSTSSSIPTTLSGGNSSGSKRRRDDPGEKDERPKKTRRVPDEKIRSTPIQRLACFYNKYDPIMYRSNAQTNRKFEVCESHDFENMNRL
jgi:hypothetical protein